MIICQLNSFYEELKKDGIIFCFSGPISQTIVESMGETIRRKMKMDLTALSTIQKVFSVFIEQMQNIIHYSAEVTSSGEDQKEELKAGTLILGIKDGRFYICCGNYIAAERAKALSKNLATLQSLNKDELKRLYKEQRKAAPPEDSLGAGLGFIEIARKAHQPIDFDIKPVDENVAFFSMLAIV